jgi:hypothetical protein
VPTTNLNLATKTNVTDVPIEDQHSERSTIHGNRDPYESERREAKLVATARQK